MYNITNINSTLSDVYRAKGLNEYATNEELSEVELFKGYPDSLLQFAFWCTVLYIIVGIPGNLFTIIALARYKKVHNATALFIINLSFSDLLFCCFNLPLASLTYWNKSWTSGKVLCYMFPLGRYGLISVSVYTIFAITLNRYVLISHPRFYPKLYKPWYLAAMVASIWIFSFAELIPTMLGIWGQFGLDVHTDSCTIIPDADGKSSKKFLFASVVLVSYVIIAVLYARIFYIVRKTLKKSQQKSNMSRINSLANVNKGLDVDKDSDQVRYAESHLPRCLYISVKENQSSSASTSEVNEKKCTFDEPVFNRSKPKNKTFAIRRSIRNLHLPTSKDKRLLTMISAILFTFLICYIPITIIKLLSELKFDDQHPTLSIVSYLLIYLTMCINPIVYVVMSSEYRQAYVSLMNTFRQNS